MNNHYIFKLTLVQRFPTHKKTPRSVSGIQGEHLSVEAVGIPTQIPQAAKSSLKQQTGRLLTRLATDARKDPSPHIFKFFSTNYTTL